MIIAPVFEGSKGSPALESNGWSCFLDLGVFSKQYSSSYDSRLPSTLSSQGENEFEKIIVNVTKLLNTYFELISSINTILNRENALSERIFRFIKSMSSIGICVYVNMRKMRNVTGRYGLAYLWSNPMFSVAIRSHLLVAIADSLLTTCLPEMRPD